MINPKTKMRELCYVVAIDSIEPIKGKDRVECARVGGWTVMVRKGQFAPGDLGIYFEIDSKVPVRKCFAFLEKKHYKIKTQKYGSFYSQGLLMSAEDFDGYQVKDEDKHYLYIEGENYNEGDFLTDKLGVKYASAADNERKKRTVDKYQRMSQRMGTTFSKQPYRWLMKRDWGKKILYKIYGKKEDSPRYFPKHFPYIKITDQERIENMVWILEDKTPYIVTQKCDGSSATYILARTHKLFGDKFEYYVCSRNIRQFDMNQKCFHDDNYYWAAEFKYNIRTFLEDCLNKNPYLEYVCVQGELCGPKIQGNPHGLKELHFFAFHMIDSEKGRYDIREAKEIWDAYGIESVPIICDNFIMPDDFENLKLMADGMYHPSVCEGQTDRPREGFVYYSCSDPDYSFKNVSRKYLLKH